MKRGRGIPELCWSLTALDPFGARLELADPRVSRGRALSMRHGHRSRRRSWRCHASSLQCAAESERQAASGCELGSLVCARFRLASSLSSSPPPLRSPLTADSLVDRRAMTRKRLRFSIDANPPDVATIPLRFGKLESQIHPFRAHALEFLGFEQPPHTTLGGGSTSIRGPGDLR